MQDIAGLSRNYKYVLFFDGWIFSGLYSFERPKAKKNGEQYKRWGNYFFCPTRIKEGGQWPLILGDLLWTRYEVMYVLEPANQLWLRW